MLRSRIRTAGFAVALALSAIAVAAPPAQAAGVGLTAVSDSCTLHIGTTFMYDSYIYGYGSRTSSCGSGTSYVTIQRKGFIGWGDVATRTVTSNNIDYYAVYGCAGTGTQSYRTIHYGYTIGGGYKQATSNTIRVTC